MLSVDDNNEVKDCIYKEEHYSVRDDGAVMRHQRVGKKKRTLDNEWTFGKPDKNGYMAIAGQSVHRIVAFAFHGNPPTDEHVVDHYDTNRQNNRPNNLRWVTKLENILNNEITRKKVELICGSVEAFLENPSLLYGHEKEDNNFSWMRRVTREEARISLAKMTEWAKWGRKPKGGTKGEWLFHDSYDKEKQKDEPSKTPSLTPNAIQLNWKHPESFPCCPQHFSCNPLKAYQANLEKGKLFATNEFGDALVLNFGMPQPDCLWVMCQVRIGFKTHAFTKITYDEGIFYHENRGVYDIGDDPEEAFDSILKGES